MKYILFLLLASACASKQPVVMQAAPTAISEEKYIDWEKVKTTADLKLILKLMYPSLHMSVRKDSIEDSKKTESIKHLLLNEKENKK